ncbi:MAG TPA: acyl carrier protein [Herpetosiphonaceae bacterium]
MRQAELIALVIDVVQAEINDSSVQIEEMTPLQDLSSFDSLVVVGVLERLEQQLGVEMDPALILPETFATPRAIAEALMQSYQPSNA